ncbi:MAG: hypothetical protein ACOZQL_42225 [Myxococcota bacterium]
MRAVLLLIVASGVLAHAAPPSVQECVSASVSGQEAWKRGALFTARQALERCADAACPQLVRTDCTRWLEEVLSATPSLIVVVRLNGVDRPDARVLVDGKPWLERLTGRPQDIEPGAHELLVEVATQKEVRQVIVVQGEKNRVLTFELKSDAPVALKVEPETKPAPLAVTKPTEPPALEATFPTLPMIFSGVALAGGVAFAGLGLSGKGKLDRLLTQPCAATKTCNPAEVQAIQREFVAADVSLGIGIASAVTAIGLWWWWLGKQPPEVALVPGPGSAALVGRW